MEHVREPYNLDDHKYGEWTLDLDEFFGDDRSGPHRPDHLVAEIAAKGLAFRTALDAMDTALANRKTASNLIKNTIEDMEKLLRWMRNVLPTLSDESILLPFGLDRNIPTTYAAIKDYADTVNTHWQAVKLEPLFAPVATEMDELAPLLPIYDAARAAQIVADGEYDQFQNEKDLARAAYHEVERKAFNWYASFYPDGQDIYWEQTSWGKAYSEGGDPEDPPAPEKWDDPLTGLTAEEGPPGVANISANVHEDADGIRIYVAEGPQGVSAHPIKPSVPVEPQVPQPYFLPISAGVRSWIWVCAVKDGVEGPIAGPVWVEPTL